MIEMRSAATLALTVALAFAVTGCSLDDPEVSAVDKAAPRLLDDGAGQRYFEVTYPAGTPRATMFLIHGGAWTSHGPATFAESNESVNRAVKAGFRVVEISTDHSPAVDNPTAAADGRLVLDDVLAFHDQVRDAFPAEPVCASGVSGGGHLALMLAVERPGLECVVAVSAPTDIVRLARDTGVSSNPRAACAKIDSRREFGGCLAMITWGRHQPDWRRASPARRWDPEIETAVWAGYERGDPLIPSSQRAALAQAIEGATIEILRPDPDGALYGHLNVNAADRSKADSSLAAFFDQVLPSAAEPAAEVDAELVSGTHEACNSRLRPGPPFQRARRGDRADLLEANGRWLPEQSTPVLGVANSCDGREAVQNSGLAVWAPGFSQGNTRFMERGEQVAWNFETPEGAIATELRASFRGFIANPGTWKLGLYARGSDNEDWTAVTECDGADCPDFETQSAGPGVTVVPAGSPARAERSKKLPVQVFSLPPGARQLSWRLECVARRGCLPRSINPASTPTSPRPTRPIDPTGRPAVLSLYELEVDTREG